MLLHHNIKPVLVFDGRNLPSKAKTENKRRVKRFDFFIYCLMIRFFSHLHLGRRTEKKRCSS